MLRWAALWITGIHLPLEPYRCGVWAQLIGGKPMDERHQVMLSKIRNGAIRAFGEEQAEGWLSRKWRIFDDRSPMEMATCESDTRRVLDYVSQLTSAEDALKNAGIRDCEN